jgi:tRNA A37 methylthiotransferase MiaB
LGSDLPQKPNLAKLIATFAEKYPSVWFRFLYLQPEGISDELIDVVKTHDNICNYFDIPIQHVSPHLLKKMNREGSFEEYLSMFDRIREGVPEVNLRTTLMVGFPGETEEDFEELLSFISLAKLDKAAVFSYSREDGTNAYSYSDQIDDSVKLSRLQIIKDKLDNIAFSKNQSMIKNVFQCLVTNATENTPVIAATRLLAGAGEPRSGERNVGDLANEEGFAFHSRANDANPLNLSKLVARAQFQAPDIDGEIEFHGDSSLIGNFLDIRLTGSFGYDFEGEAIV